MRCLPELWWQLKEWELLSVTCQKKKKNTNVQFIVVNKIIIIHIHIFIINQQTYYAIYFFQVIDVIIDNNKVKLTIKRSQ